ncbi:PQQ-binding-like beta-propeller repeat protein [Deinococcus sonorensis]|uniref:PQQ-binding-like beta-propeller repeat protein n=1 Tax=Deinococcus sonorensis TaxID=309891 RepID=A0ABV8YBG9_9DEIO
MTTVPSLLRSSLVALATLLLAGCAQEYVEPGTSPPPGVSRFVPSWQLKQPGRGASALVHGLLLTDSVDTMAKDEVKTLAAVDVSRHALAWNVPVIPGRIDGGRPSFAAVGDNIVAVALDRAHEAARLVVYAQQGTVLRTIPLPNTYTVTGMELGPRVVGDQLLVADAVYLYAYDVASLSTDTPVLRWQKKINSAPTSSIQIMGLEADPDGNLYIGTFANEVISYTSTGTQRWKVSTTTSPYYGHAPFSLVLDAGRLFVESQDEGLQAYDLATGKTLWDKPADLLKACPGAPTSTATYLVAGGGKVYAGLFGGDCLPAYNESDGSLAWSFTPNYRQTFLSRPTYVNGVLYATNGRVYAIETASGKLLAQGTEDIPASAGTYLPYDPVQGEVYVWGGQTLYAYKALR